MGISYNRQLMKRREEAGLTLKAAAKAIGISSFRLFLYEGGYARPRGKALEKIESFYGFSLDYSGDREYPSQVPAKEERAKPKKAKLIVSGIVVALSVGLFFGGASLFDASASNRSSAYGQVYNEARATAFEKGGSARDLVTDLEYSYFDNEGQGFGMGRILFYKTNSYLYFNNSIYTNNLGFVDMPELGICRYQFQFGGDMSRDSYLCTFTVGSSKALIFFTAEVLYRNQEIDHFDKLVVHSQSEIPVTEELARYLFNIEIGDAINTFSKALSIATGKSVSFYNDFLPAREQGRKTHLAMQSWGLGLVFPSIIFFFVALTVFLFALLRKPRLVEASEPAKEEGAPLPKDLSVNIGIPDFLLIWLSRILGYGSLAVLLLVSILNVVTKLPPFFSSDGFLNFLRISFLVAPFLRMWVIVRSPKTSKILLGETFKHGILHLFIATMETALIAITRMWGYNIAELLSRFIPSTVFFVAALNYLICFFLFVTPAFADSRRKVVFWRLLSLLPVAAMVVATALDKSYDLIYGAQKNIYFSIWISNASVLLSLASLLLIYGTFFTDCFFKRKFGEARFCLYRNGNRYQLISNLVCTLAIVVAGLVDLAFIGNEFGYYIGLGNGVWIFTLIPFVLLCRSGPDLSSLARVEDTAFI